MPSPTSSTRPTSCASSLPRTSVISCWRTETISLGLNRMTTSLKEGSGDRGQGSVILSPLDPHPSPLGALGLNRMTASLEELVPYVFQASADAGVVHHVADLNRHSAQQIGIDARFQHGVAAKRLTQFLAEPFALVVGQRQRREHLYPDFTGSFFVETADAGRNRTKGVQTVVVVEYQKKVQKQSGCPALEGGAEGALLTFAAYRFAREERFQVAVLGKNLVHKRVQILEGFFSLTAFLGGVQERLGVDARHVLGGVVKDRRVMGRLFEVHRLHARRGLMTVARMTNVR